MAEREEPKRWSIQRRLEFIEFRLFWEGSLQRSDISEQFGVSIPQTSLDIAKYREAAPENIEYDASAKRFVPSTKFEPVFYQPNPGRYLSQLKAIKDDVIEASDTLFGTSPACTVVPVLGRTVTPNSLRRIIQAIRNRKSLSIHYQSMNPSRPDPIWREITPHALASDNSRWHVRAFCHIDEAFKDFILSRFIRVGKLNQPGAAAEDDEAWNDHVHVKLIPNPEFSDPQKATVARDYGMRDGRIKLKVRRALLLYFHKQNRFDVPIKLGNPNDTPIVIENRDAYEEALPRNFR